MTTEKWLESRILVAFHSPLSNNSVRWLTNTCHCPLGYLLLIIKNSIYSTGGQQQVKIALATLDLRYIENIHLKNIERCAWQIIKIYANNLTNATEVSFDSQFEPNQRTFRFFKKCVNSRSHKRTLKKNQKTKITWLALLFCLKISKIIAYFEYH